MPPGAAAKCLRPIPLQRLLLVRVFGLLIILVRLRQDCAREPSKRLGSFLIILIHLRRGQQGQRGRENIADS